MSEEGEKYRFEYHHFRPSTDFQVVKKEIHCERYMRGVSDWKPHERGGVTVCYIYAEEKGPIAMGLSFCCMRDNFSYRLGREIARGRALNVLKGYGMAKQFNRYTLATEAVWMGWNTFSIPA